MRLRYLILWLFFLPFVVSAQDISADSLLSDLDRAQEEQPLLPDRIFITQRIFWGEKGLLRVTGLAPLTKEHREKELRIRRTMLKLHQVAGFATLAGMIAQGIVGSKLYNHPTPSLRNTHEQLAGFVNAGYATTAGLAFFAPPPLINRKGITSIKIHKALAIVHLTGMITTNVLAEGANKNLHRAAAYTTFGAFAAAVIVIKF